MNEQESIAKRIRVFLSHLWQSLTRWVPGKKAAPAAPSIKKLNLLFVCTGNTCRSPMAKAIAEQMVRETPRYSALIGSIDSAGAAAMNGDSASEHSQRVIQERGGDLSQHRAKRVTQEIIDRSDVVVSMTKGLSTQMAQKFDNGHTRFFSMGEFAGIPDGQVPDPFGGNLPKYRHCAKTIAEYLLLGLVDLANHAESGS